MSDRVALTAAGCAFYATLALFPAISILISIYGLAFDPWNVEPQLHALRELLPPPAFELIAGRVHQLVAQPSGRLSVDLGGQHPGHVLERGDRREVGVAALNLAYARPSGAASSASSSWGSAWRCRRSWWP